MSALKSVGSSGQITLGKRFAGRRFVIEERGNGELLLRPVRVVADAPGDAAVDQPTAFRIAEVERVYLPSREERNARR